MIDVATEASEFTPFVSGMKMTKIQPLKTKTKILKHHTTTRSDEGQNQDLLLDEDISLIDAINAAKQKYKDKLFIFNINKIDAIQDDDFRVQRGLEIVMQDRAD